MFHGTLRKAKLLRLLVIWLWKVCECTGYFKINTKPSWKNNFWFNFFEGENIIKTSDTEIRNIRGKNFNDFQEPMTSLNPLMTIGKQISEVLDRHLTLSKKETYQKAKNILDIVQIPDSKDG